jgi:polyribonucleotide nucleotidyltransferase
MVQAITAEPIVGDTYEGQVKSTTAFGAFIEIMPGTEGLLHISEMRHARVDKTEDVVKKGDRVKVKLIERDERGRLRLSMKALQPKPEGGAEGASEAPAGEGSYATAEGSDAGEGGENGGGGGGERRRPPRSGGGGGRGGSGRRRE